MSFNRSNHINIPHKKVPKTITRSINTTKNIISSKIQHKKNTPSNRLNSDYYFHYQSHILKAKSIFFMTTISSTTHISSKQIPFFVLYPISSRPPPIKIQLTPIKWTDKNIPKTITRSTATIGNIIWKQNSTNKEHAAGTRLYSHYRFHNQSTTHIFSLKAKSLSCTYRIPSPQLLQINIHSTPLHSQQARPHILPPLWSWFQEKFNKQRNGNSVPQDKISQESHKK